MNIIEQRQIKILWIIFALVLVPGFFWQLGVKLQQFVLKILNLPHKPRINAFFDDRD